jgi:Copper amine oxidase N-terminal domain
MTMRRTRILGVLLIVVAAMALVAPQVAPAQQAIRVYIDGRLVNFDVPPTSVQGRVLVPLRGVFEQLGATVDYDARSQHIVAIRGAQTVELTIGSRQARVSGAPRLLDVPAFTINGRTMVPLRFISEALGASVQWIAASQTILIGTTGAAQAPPPPSTPPVSTTEISGRLVAVTTGENSRIVIRHDGQDSTIIVTPATGISRFNVETNAGGSAALGMLQKGDQATATVNQNNEATKVVATYRVPPAAKIASVNRDTRTVTLSDGRTYVVMSDADITLNGQKSDFSALEAGRIALFSVIEGTNQAYEVHVSIPAAATPPPQSVLAPNITAPANGTTVNSSFTVKGTAQPGATVVVKVQGRLLGDTKQAQTTVAANGLWQMAMSVDALPFVAFPYVVSAVQIVNGTQSDPASVEVTVH